MILGQLVRFYAPQLPAYLVAVLLLALRAQLNGVAEGNTCIAFHSAIASGSKPYFLLPILKIAVHILRYATIIREDYMCWFKDIYVPDLARLRNFSLPQTGSFSTPKD